jgi:hypothetical protein
LRGKIKPTVLFYTRPRLVQHLDDAAIDMVKGTYGRFLNNDMAVMDLMGSWQSHLPAVPLKRLAGLGMNEEELRKNPLLTDFTVHDLNRTPQLPFRQGDCHAPGMINTSRNYGLPTRCMPYGETKTLDPVFRDPALDTQCPSFYAQCR